MTNTAQHFWQAASVVAGFNGAAFLPSKWTPYVAIAVGLAQWLISARASVSHPTTGEKLQ